EEWGAARLDAHVEDFDDVLLPDARGGARLALEARDRDAIVREVAVEHFDCDGAADRHVLRLVDGAHAAAPEDAPQSVFTGDQRADQAAPGEIERGAVVRRQHGLTLLVPPDGPGNSWQCAKGTPEE